MAKGSVLLEIVTGKGPGGFASLQSLIGMIGKAAKAVKGFMQDAEAFALTYDRLTEAQKKAALAADSFAKGILDTHNAFKMSVTLEEARKGFGENAELMKSIAALAVDVGQKMGEGPESLNARIMALTDAISKGQSRALKEYGVELRNTSDLHKAQAEGMAKVIERAQGLEVQVRTTSEAFFGLKNNIGTAIGLMFDLADAGSGTRDAIGLVNSTLGDLNNELIDMTDESAAFKDAFLEIGAVVKGVGFEIGIAAAELVGFSAEVNRLTDLATASAERSRKLAETRQYATTGASQLMALGMPVPTAPGQAPAPSTGSAIAGPKKAWGKKGGKGKKKGYTGVSISRVEITDTAEADAGQRAVIIDLEQERAARMGLQEQWEQEADTKERMAVVERERLAYLQQRTDAELLAADKTAMWDAEIEHEQAMREIEEQKVAYLLERRDIHIGHHAELLGVEQEYVLASARQWESGLQGKAQKMGEFFGYVAQLQQTKHRALWQIGKMAAIGEAAVNTYLGAIKAYQAMSGIPIVGPALGGIAAAAVTAAGMAAIANIRKQKFGSGSVSTSGMSISGGGGGAGLGSYGGGAATQQPNVAVYVSGSLGQAVEEVKVAYNGKISSGEWPHGWAESDAA